MQAEIAMMREISEIADLLHEANKRLRKVNRLLTIGGLPSDHMRRQITDNTLRYTKIAHDNAKLLQAAQRMEIPMVLVSQHPARRRR